MKSGNERYERIQTGNHRVTVRSNHDTFWENERALYVLLADHPFFVASVAKIRKELDIPRDGFTDGQKAWMWEHSDKTSRHRLTEKVEQMMAEFTVKPAFRSEVKDFARNYTLSPEIEKYRLVPLSESEDLIRHVGRYKIGAQIIKTGDDIEKNKYQFRVRATYLELTGNTSRRDVTLALKEANKQKKDRLPFSVPKPEAIARRVWHLSQQKLPGKKIAEHIRKEFGKPNFGYDSTPPYLKRYKDALSTLKALED